MGLSRNIVLRQPTKREQEKAVEILAWLPRPLFNKGSSNGPGVDRLREITSLGYQSLKNMSVGNRVMPRLFVLLESAHDAMRKEKQEQASFERVFQPEKPTSLEAAILSQLQELNTKIDRLLEVWK